MNLLMILALAATQPAAAATSPTAGTTKPAAALSAAPAGGAPVAAPPSGMLPVPGSTVAEHVDWPFNFILWTSVVFFGLIIGPMFAFVVMYRRRAPEQEAVGNITHNTPLELAWSIGPGFLLAYMFWLGFQGFMSMATVPQEAYEINVSAAQWTWGFKYPNGLDSPELHVPANEPVRLVLRSSDVIHSFFVPAFRVKMDAVPGRYNKLWFNATRPGEYLLLCTEYCGKDHSLMNAKVVVHPTRAAFDDWLANADPLKKLTPEQLQEYLADPMKFIAAHPEIQGLLPPAKMGEKLYTSKGCKSCHSLDGIAGTGPTWQGLFGSARKFASARDGNLALAAADENYIRESILNPGDRVVEGFGNNMATYQGRITDTEITMIIEYIKTLKKK